MAIELSLVVTLALRLQICDYKAPTIRTGPTLFVGSLAL
jgi:hypothetical protein